MKSTCKAVLMENINKKRKTKVKNFLAETHMQAIFKHININTMQKCKK